MTVSPYLGRTPSSLSSKPPPRPARGVRPGSDQQTKAVAVPGSHLRREAAFLGTWAPRCVPGAARISESVAMGTWSGGWCHAQIRANHSAGPDAENISWFQVFGAQGGTAEDTAAAFRADGLGACGQTARAAILFPYLPETRTGSTESAKPPSWPSSKLRALRSVSETFGGPELGAEVVNSEI